MHSKTNRYTSSAWPGQSNCCHVFTKSFGRGPNGLKSHPACLRWQLGCLAAEEAINTGCEQLVAEQGGMRPLCIHNAPLCVGGDEGDFLSVLRGALLLKSSCGGDPTSCNHSARVQIAAMMLRCAMNSNKKRLCYQCMIDWTETRLCYQPY